MASRTYLPKLLFILKLVCKYMLEWQVQIKSHLGGGSTEAAFDAALAACQVLVPLIEALIPDPT
jgi:hypothetical protein